MRKIKVVLIGGGTGLSVLARGLKKYPLDISAIVTVADDGGSTGLIREQIDMPAPGDIRNVLSALSDREDMLENLFKFRFKETEISGHSLGNLMIAAMYDIMGDFSLAVKELSKILNVRGEVIPSTNSSPKLAALMEDRSIYIGESSIPKAKKKIEKLFLLPMDLKGSPEAIEAIAAADYIIMGPGSLYTSIIPNLLPRGIKKVLQECTARKIYICNIMEQPGETLGMSAFDHVKAINDHVEKEIIEFMIMSEVNLNDDQAERYTGEGIDLVEFDKEKIEAYGIKVKSKQNLIELDEKGYIRHDYEVLAEMVYELILRELDAFKYEE